MKRFWTLNILIALVSAAIVTGCYVIDDDPYYGAHSFYSDPLTLWADVSWEDGYYDLYPDECSLVYYTNWLRAVTDEYDEDGYYLYTWDDDGRIYYLETWSQIWNYYGYSVFDGDYYDYTINTINYGETVYDIVDGIYDSYNFSHKATFEIYFDNHANGTMWRDLWLDDAFNGYPACGYLYYVALYNWDYSGNYYTSKNQTPAKKHKLIAGYNLNSDYAKSSGIDLGILHAKLKEMDAGAKELKTQGLTKEEIKEFMADVIQNDRVLKAYANFRKDVLTALREYMKDVKSGATLPVLNASKKKIITSAKSKKPIVEGSVKVEDLQAIESFAKLRPELQKTLAEYYTFAMQQHQIEVDRKIARDNAQLKHHGRVLSRDEVIGM